MLINYLSINYKIIIKKGNFMCSSYVSRFKNNLRFKII